MRLHPWIYVLLLIGLFQSTHAQIYPDTTVTLPDQIVYGNKYNSIKIPGTKQFTIDNHPSAIDATAAEALRQIPSLITDIEGTVTYRGANQPGFLLNGIPYGLLEEYNGDVLIQLPAEFFNRVLISSFPAIDWSPEGEGGTINLASTHNTRKDEYIFLHAGGGWHERYNAGAVIKRKYDHLNITAKYNYRKEYRSRTFNKTTTDATGTSTMNNNATARPDIHLADLNISYQLTPADQISFYGLYHYMDYDRYGRINNRKINPAGDVLNHIYRHRNNRQKQDAWGTELRWIHLFKRKFADQLEFIANYNEAGYNEGNDFQNEKPDNGAILAEDRLYIEHNKSNLYLSAVLKKEFPQGGVFKWGYTGRLIKETYEAKGENKRDNAWIPNETNSTDYTFHRNMHMLFTSFEIHSDRWIGEAGIQLEYKDQKVSQHKNETIHIYPRARFGYQWNKNSLNLQYLQRTVRPAGYYLNPYIDRSDATYIVQGNPDLKDEFIHSLELSSAITLQQFQLTPTIYYRHRTNRIVGTLEESGIWLRGNTGTCHILGAELATQWKPIHLMTISLSGNIYRDEIDGRTLGYGEKKSMFCGDFKGSLQITICKNTAIQLDGFYISDLLAPQGKIESRYSVNAGIIHTFPRDYFRLNLSVQNIFDSLKEVTRIDTEKLQVLQERNRDARVLWLSLGYRF